MSHEELLEKARQAIQAVFSDDSVDAETVAESLAELAADIEVMLDSLP